MSEKILNPDEQKLWEEARGWAAAEILAKYHEEFQQAHEKQFSRLTKRAADVGRAARISNNVGRAPRG